MQIPTGRTRNHRVTEDTEPPTCHGVAAQRRSRTHVANTKTRRHEEITKSTHPPMSPQITQITQIRPPTPKRRGAEPQRRREVHTEFKRPARLRPSGDGRDRWVGPKLRTQALVAVSQPSGLRLANAGLATTHNRSINGGRLLSNKKRRVQGRPDVPAARRPVRSEATRNVHDRSRSASHRRQAIIDRLSFCLQ